MNLTEVFDVDKAASRTPKGMAHWAGTGPDGKSCGQCAHYVQGKPKTNGGFRDGTCAQYARMMRRSGNGFPSRTPACKYFEAKPAA